MMAPACCLLDLDPSRTAHISCSLQGPHTLKRGARKSKGRLLMEWNLIYFDCDPLPKSLRVRVRVTADRLHVRH